MITEDSAAFSHDATSLRKNQRRALLPVVVPAYVQIIGIGVIGKYLGRMFDEIKHRPIYLVDSHEPAPNGQLTALQDRSPAVQSLQTL